MRVLNAHEIRKVENKVFSDGITELELMKTAGRRCAEAIKKHFDLPNKMISVLVACGSGKNGGDGFVIANILSQAGCDVKIVLAEKLPELPECKVTFEEARRAGISYHLYAEDGEKYFGQADLIIDCLFGIGFHGETKGIYCDIFHTINRSEGKVVSVDVPSGTDATTGQVVNLAICADLTVAISTLKFSHILPPANSCCGKVKVVNIGIPDESFKIVSDCAQTIVKEDIQFNFTQREKNANKGDFGRVLSVCGSRQMPGAAVIAAKGVVRSGAGLITCAFPKSAYSAMTSHMIEPLFLPLEETEAGQLCLDAQPTLLAELEKANGLLIGCGLGGSPETGELVKNLLRSAKCPVVLDADGINAVRGNIDVLGECTSGLVLTPHPGEMARLIDEDAAFVQNHRVEVAKGIAKDFRMVLVLKGANTIVTDGFSTFINTRGNPGMAKGGTGDLLAGMITGFIAQGMKPLEAAKSAVYIHSVVGDICAGELSQRGMSVSDMLELLPAYLSKFEREQ